LTNNAFVISPDGSTLAVMVTRRHSDLVQTQWWGISFASMATGKVDRTVEIPDGWIRKLYFPTSNRVIALSWDKMYVLDLERGEVIRGRPGNYDSDAVSPDGSRFARLRWVFPSEKGELIKASPESIRYVVSLHDVESGEEVGRLPEVFGRAKGLAWTPDGRYILVGGEPGMGVIDVEAMSLVVPEVGGYQPVLPPQMVAGRFVLLSNFNHESNAVFDLALGVVVPVLAPAGCYVIAVAPDGERVLVRKSMAIYFGRIAARQSER